MQFGNPFAQWAMDFLLREGPSQVRSILAVSDGVSSSDIEELRKSGYVSVRFPDKFREKNSLMTWECIVSLTDRGRKLLETGLDPEAGETAVAPVAPPPEPTPKSTQLFLWAETGRQI
jgi:hypothetical protein